MKTTDLDMLDAALDRLVEGADVAFERAKAADRRDEDLAEQILGILSATNLRREVAEKGPGERAIQIFDRRGVAAARALQRLFKIGH